MDNHSETHQLEHLFNVGKLIVPSYQRAYAWEEEQLKQFVSDMLEIEGKGEYYFGHFILEKTKDDDFEIIDGQQRITTFILFLMVSQIFKNDRSLDNYIHKFETVDYDRKSFELIKENLKDTVDDWKIGSFELPNKGQTLSIQRILFALNYFRKLFKEEKRLYINKIDSYIRIFIEAAVSTHIIISKAVAVQIFELQNTRGIRLNLIEKVKSRLMKVIYLNAEAEMTEEKINRIQEEFSKIYQLEEQATSNAFRGELLLEDILLHHLRMIDNGSKLNASDKNVFNNPNRYGNKEELILNYIDKRINEQSKQNVVDYITDLSNKFRLSVTLICVELPKYDETNRLIGDVLILDKGLSLEFFILLFHRTDAAGGSELVNKIFKSDELLRLWERLLFTRDFHDKYYRQQYRDDFEMLFHELVVNDPNDPQAILKKYVIGGFRKDLMDEESLSLTVSKFIEINRNNILNNSFHWFVEKMVYVLYKYELSQNADLNMLRNIMKEGRSVEHILPQSWEWAWIAENDFNNTSENGKKISDEIRNIINGLGNLLLLTPGENSSLSNKHPEVKEYSSCRGGSYDEHNNNKRKWKDYTEWGEIINSRGEKIFDFMKRFIQ